MLQISRIDTTGNASESGIPSLGGLIEDILGVVRRQRELFGAVLLLGLLGACIYILTAQPMFTSTAKLVIDTRKIQPFQQQGMSLLGEPQLDSPTVDSQVEIIKSENIAKSVIEDLKLTDDPEFAADDRNTLRRVFSALAWAVGRVKSISEPSAELFGEPNLLRRAIGRFAARLAATRVGTTYVISVSFTSQDSAKSAQIANAIVATYIREQLETKSQVARQASSWLQDRLAELRDQALVADRAVQGFKAKNNIIDTGRGLMNEQQLAEINTQLMLARAQTVEARARLDRIKEILRQDIQHAAITDALRSNIIVRLREQYLDLSRREAEWASRMPADHPSLTSLRNEMRELQRAMRQELEHIGESYESEYEIARQREAALQGGVDELVRQSVQTNQDRVTLRELESNAQTYRTLADAFLQRYMVVVQQESFPITDARSITDASPGGKSQPRTILILGVALVGSTLAGYGACMVRDQLDRVIRSAAQVEELLGAPCLGLIPRVSDALRENSELRGSGKQRNRGSHRDPTDPFLLRSVVTTPDSDFAEAIRSVKVGLDLRGLAVDKRIVGVTSVLPSEGKTTIAVSLAHLAAKSGQRVLLIDCDLHKPSLSCLASNASGGLPAVLEGTASLDDVLSRDPASGVWVLPADATKRFLQRSLLISSPQMLQLLERARTGYDLVVLDLLLADARAISRAIDSFVVVVEWGRSSVDVVRSALASSDALSNRIDGFVINKVNMRMMRRYEGLSGVDSSKYTHGKAS